MDTLIKPVIHEDILRSLQQKIYEEKQVIVHCLVEATPFPDLLIRIWRTTFLVDGVSGHRSALIHAENISIFPEWTQVPAGREFWFTLVFQGLPADCKIFDLQEIIPQSGGFAVHGIARNTTDVYRVKIL